MKKDMTYNVFIDDVYRPIDIYNRHLPSNPVYKQQFVVVKSYDQFVKYVEEQFKMDGTYPGFISFDYLLAEVSGQVTDDRQVYFNDGAYVQSGLECAEWIINFCKEKNIPIPKYAYHDINPFGKKSIVKLFNSVTISNKVTDPFIEEESDPESVVSEIAKIEITESVVSEITETTVDTTIVETSTIDEPISVPNNMKKSEFQELYWTGLKEYLEKNQSTVKIKKPLPQYWSNIPMGRSDFYISAMVNSRENILTVELCLMGNESKINFDKLKEICYDNSINEINGIIWDKMDNNKTSSYILVKCDGDFTKTNNWLNQFEWFKVTLEKFTDFFKPIIKNL